ncbi:MAG: TRAP transporter small permease [Paenibacillaceae bacterium]
MIRIWRGIRAGALIIDKIIENFALSALAAMTFIVTMQVFTRKLFNFVFFWSEEITLLLLIWFAVLGIAIGFREKLHLAMDSFTNLFPASWNKVLDKIIATCTFMFGVYLIIYGWDFTVMMHANTLSATQWPVSVMYIVMPITGVLVCIYSFLELLGVDTVRHQDLGEAGLE